MTDQTTIVDELLRSVETLPLICPHGHVDPRLFVDEHYRFGSPVDLLIIPDHYIFRMLYSQGIQLEDLGIPRLDGGPVETDHRKIWQTVADHWYLFRGTPTGQWIKDELRGVFGIDEKLNGENAMTIYDAIADKLTQPEFTPRRLFERFNIEILATTDSATDSLEHHQAIKASGWSGKIIPTFRPDDVVDVWRPDWRDNINTLSDLTKIDIVDYKSYICAIETRRDHFREMGAVATDHGTEDLTIMNMNVDADMDSIFVAYMNGDRLSNGGRLIRRTMWELARMSAEDGLVMQVHVGSKRNHNKSIYERFGADKGADIPDGNISFTRKLQPVLNEFGNDPRFRLIVFTLDETTYSRELAPLAGHYPSMLIGPPWWFHDSANGMRRYFDQVMETAGIYNTAGFNDDTRAFPSIPARHQVWRRASAQWVAGLLADGRIDEEDAHAMMHDLAYGLAKRAYRLEG